MKRPALITLFLTISLTLLAGPTHAKKPGSDEASLPKGLQKKVERGGELPPGWQKKLQKGEVLEQSVVDHGEPVSSKVKATLPVGDAGSIDITLDGKIIRLQEKTRQILDVFEIKL